MVWTVSNQDHYIVSQSGGELSQFSLLRKLQFSNRSKKTRTGGAASVVYVIVQDPEALPDISNKSATAQCALAQRDQRQWEIWGFRCGVGQEFASGTLRAFGISGQRVGNIYKSTPCNVTEQRRPQYHRVSVVRIHIFMPIHALQKYWITWMLFENKHTAILFKYVGEKMVMRKIMYEKICLTAVGWSDGVGYSEYFRILTFRHRLSSI
jgi:hypothetical protein